MVRVNLISPSKLADQHLIAEYDEILMLLGYVHRFGFWLLCPFVPSRFKQSLDGVRFFRLE
jgi:hypothetical protein